MLVLYTIVWKFEFTWYDIKKNLFVFIVGMKSFYERLLYIFHWVVNID